MKRCDAAQTVVPASPMGTVTERTRPPNSSSTMSRPRRTHTRCASGAAGETMVRELSARGLNQA
jgi:hypothetical protein